jgi:serine/threonine-protein kinase RsbW
MGGRTTVRLDIPSRIQLLDAADALVGEVAKSAGFDEDSRQDIQVAVRESLVNAIVHGNRGDEARRVTLELALHPGGLEIEVRDEGQGFDPSCVPDPRALENLSRSSGRGILLMKTLMDDVTFTHSASGGTEVTMLKRLPRMVEGTSSSSPEGAAPP